MAKKTFTTAFNRSVESIRDVATMKFTKPSKVVRSLSYATDINKIYKDFCATGKLPLNGQQPIFDENFVKYDSLIEAQKLVDDACKYFNGLPADIKSYYGNSLEKFVKGLNNGDDFLVDKGVLVVPDIKPIDNPIIPSSADTTGEGSNEGSNTVNTATTD